MRRIRLKPILMGACCLGVALTVITLARSSPHSTNSVFAIVQANSEQPLTSLFERLDPDNRFAGGRPADPGTEYCFIRRLGKFLGLVTSVHAQGICPGNFYINNTWDCQCGTPPGSYPHATPDGGYMEVCNGVIFIGGSYCDFICPEGGTYTCPADNCHG
jgi:hypothetical protein